MHWSKNNTKLGQFYLSAMYQCKRKGGLGKSRLLFIFFFSSKNVILVLGFLKMLNKQETSTMAVNEQTYCRVIFVKTKVL